MGVQIRKRTKGKNGWVNGSYSSRGAHASVSVKPTSNITYNSGSLLGGKYKRPSRLTVDLGNGIRWVSYGSSKKSTSKSKAPTDVGDGVRFLQLLALIAFVGIALLVVCGMILTAFQ